MILGTSSCVLKLRNFVSDSRRKSGEKENFLFLRHKTTPTETTAEKFTFTIMAYIYQYFYHPIVFQYEINHLILIMRAPFSKTYLRHMNKQN